jgi:hypothetical protein
MTRPTVVTEAPTPPTVDEAYARLHKSILRRRAVDQLVAAIKRDLTSLPKTSIMARRSVKVLDYMRGYIGAVEEEQATAVDEYEAAVYQARKVLEEPKKSLPKKGTLGRVRNGSQPA